MVSRQQFAASTYEQLAELHRRQQKFDALWRRSFAGGPSAAQQAVVDQVVDGMEKQFAGDVWAQWDRVAALYGREDEAS